MFWVGQDERPCHVQPWSAPLKSLIFGGSVPFRLPIPRISLQRPVLSPQAHYPDGGLPTLVCTRRLWLLTLLPVLRPCAWLWFGTENHSHLPAPSVFLFSTVSKTWYLATWLQCIQSVWVHLKEAKWKRIMRRDTLSAVPGTLSSYWSCVLFLLHRRVFLWSDLTNSLNSNLWGLIR